MENIFVNEENISFKSLEGILFSADNIELICYPAAKSNMEYTIPDGVEKISSGAFYEAINLRKIVLPSGITLIDGKAFWKCSSLSEINIPDTVTKIQSDAFSGCKNISELTIPSSTVKLFTRIYGFDENGIKYNNIAIYGEENSAAQKYAEDNDIAFYPVEVSVISGDVNSNGEFNVSDVVMFQKWMTGSGNLTNWKAGDLNNDNVLNVFDLCLMRRLLIYGSI